ncbi:hypothetical protein SRB5_31430 [Streptomyces sp. RB5]|uniref:Uncharacterized protein n=1 Tax=Streptomyces smaragdinus TaxID=2585196 RepID=A0A7K0CI42_9ACTN|nr:hypothetical protein [Streptomyces smaragdinus]MQY13003.1 hypothetical protein [Streptomyces smaragdinus]
MTDFPEITGRGEYDLLAVRTETALTERTRPGGESGEFEPYVHNPAAITRHPASSAPPRRRPTTSTRTCP